ncbi:MAG: hypothetical protein P1U42_04430 [Phycisphaerales bacterium]|nr:hypothetical protein [Phycisphaerales bacterium]
MEAEIIASFTQFGVAGLVCWMWLSERRASSERERQITEAHTKLIRQNEDHAALIEVIRDNTKAMASLESGQRGLVRVIDSIETRKNVSEHDRIG